VNSTPEHVTHWQDDRTDAAGWLVVDRLVNGVSGGGLFMHPDATLDEVTDLAATMSLKNTLQRPQFGGGKGGIRFDPNSPEAVGVLRRFMLAHRSEIENIWSTGGDLYTSNEVIETIAQKDLGLPSAFVAMAKMLAREYGIPSQASAITRRITEPWNEYFSLGEAATGHSVAESIRLVTTGLVTTGRPRVAIQGFGTVGASLAHFLTASGIGTVVGVCEQDGWLSHPDGIDVPTLLRWRGALAGRRPAFAEFAEMGLPAGWQWTPRKPGQSDEDLFTQFVAAIQPDVLSPCARRYAVTEPVLRALVRGGGRTVICGANNAFSSPDIAGDHQRRGLVTLPEWASNAGTAILFAEVLKVADWDNRSAGRIFAAITTRIAEFVANGDRVHGVGRPDAPIESQNVRVN
jgi:glutamate dehydrogenase (NAD(P)+)